MRRRLRRHLARRLRRRALAAAATTPWFWGTLALVSLGAVLAFAALASTMANFAAACGQGTPTAAPVGSPGGLTVKGAPATPSQVAAASVLLGVAAQEHSTPIADTAMIYAAIWESGLTQNAPANGLGYGGVLAGLDSAYHGDSVAQARGFLTGGPGFGNGTGAIARSRQTSNVPQIAVQTEIPSIWPDNAYARETGYPGDAKATAEAAAYVQRVTGTTVFASAQVPCVPSAGVTIGGLTNPFAHVPGYVPGRVDMGVDGSGNGPVVALGSGTVYFSSTSSGWPGGGFLGVKLADGRSWYISEYFTPSVAVGQTVQVGQVVGTMTTGGIETGWALGPPTDLAYAHVVWAGHDSNANSTAAGVNFNNVLKALGARTIAPAPTILGTYP